MMQCIGHATGSSRTHRSGSFTERRRMAERTMQSGLALMHGAVTRAIIGAFFDVYNELGPGYLEAAYQRAMPVLLAERGIRAEIERPIVLNFHGVVIGEYRIDLIVEECVVVECKVATKVLPVHEAQLINYLKATGINVGLILNFGSRPSVRRMLLTLDRGRRVVVRAEN
jgi:GxxExxY protein